MKKNQAGQVFILVLILLAIAAALVLPLLQLAFTASKGSQIVVPKLKELYAAEGGQEYAAWKLKYGGLTTLLPTNGSSVNLTVDVCGIPVDILVVMRAVPGAGPLILATNDVIQPTKTVTASNPVSTEPLKVANGSYQIFTYIIKLEHLSANTTQGLDVVYDILPKDWGTGKYVSGSTYIRVDGGSWEPIGNPLAESFSGQDRLRWPASGSFPSPIRDFGPRQVKELKFQVALTIPSSAKDTVQCNWVVLKPWNTVSGPQAPVIVGSPADPTVYKQYGLLLTSKTAEPAIIPAGVQTDVKYVISITNLDGNTHHIASITDYLPPEFYYTDNTSSPPSPNPSGVFAFAPNPTLRTINGVNRQVLVWSSQASNPPIAAGQTLTQTFWARTTKNVSGTYFNEVIVELADVPNVPTIFSSIGLSQEDFFLSYSWVAGGVTVPTYDSSANTTSTTIDANMGLVPGGVVVYSWHLR